MGAFPHRKEVDVFDFDFQPSINKQQILDFISTFLRTTRKHSIFRPKWCWEDTFSNINWYSES